MTGAQRPPAGRRPAGYRLARHRPAGRRLMAIGLVLGLAAGGLRALAAGSAPAGAGHTATAPRNDAPLAAAIGAIGMTVSSVDRSAAFYSEVLSFRKMSDVEVAGPEYEHLEGVFAARVRLVTMQLGDESIVLTEYLAPRGRPIPVDSRSNDRWFQHVAIIVSDMDRAYARLREHDVQHASSGPQTLPAWNKAAGGIRAFYFKDPDGHPLEILQFPIGKGDPKWHRAGGALFLGIDHTAIVVGDTAASLRFYHDLLGLRIAGESENYGTEQEHLNGVFGARLRITGLRAAAGPGIELLQYLSPGDGRPIPADERSNDLAHWQAALDVAGDLNAAARALISAGAPLVSPGVVDLPGSQLGFRRGLLARDPDGHVLQLIERQGVAPESVGAAREGRGDEPVERQRSRTGHPEPQEQKDIEVLDEPVQARDPFVVGLPGRDDRDDHGDDQRDARQARHQADQDERAADELGAGGERRLELRHRDPQLPEIRDDVGQVVQLAPSRLHEEPADAETRESGRQPGQPAGGRQNESAECRDPVHECAHFSTLRGDSLAPRHVASFTRSLEKIRSSVQSIATRTFFSRRGSLLQ
jgi:catechol 2,3-dioxygenase-like lactoylglutathione lyase family enzyme